MTPVSIDRKAAADPVTGGSAGASSRAYAARRPRHARNGIEA
ncbi:hypothetical protein ACIA8C_42175 [Nocardia sp. NPDC051321]